MKGSFSASHEERTQLRAFTNGYSRSITISLSIINSNNKVASSTYARPDDTLSLFSFKFDAGDVLENFTVKAMLTDEVDTEYEEYGTMPSMQFSSEVKAVGQDINIFDSSIFEDIEQNGVKIKRNVDGTLTLNGTYAGTSAWNYRFNLLEPISVDKEELYLSMQKIEGNCTGQIRFTAWEQNSDNRWLSFETSQYSNLLAEKTYIRASIIIYEGATFNNLTIGLKISNKKDAIYSPYDHGSANITVCNKNTLDFSKWDGITAAHGTIEKVENGIKLTATEADCYSNSFAFRYQGTLNKERIEKYGMIAKQNTKYTFSCKVNSSSISKRLYMFFADKDFNNISSISSATSALTAVTPENCRYITVRVGVSNAGDSLIFTDFQLEEGSTATDYIEHKEQVFTVPVQQEMLEGDYFDLDNEEEVHTWGKYVFTGDETISKSGITNNNSFWMNSNFLPNLLNAEILNYTATDNITPNILCTHLKTLKPVLIVSYDNEGITICANDNNLTDITIRLGFGKSSEINTADKCKAWLKQQYDAGTPVTIYYKLAEPTKIPFSETQKSVGKEIRQTLHSYKGGTHVYSTNNPSTIFNVKYTKDTEVYIKNEINKMQAMILAGEE